MKRLMTLAVAVAAAMMAIAETETVGGYTWTYRINGDTAEIYNGSYSAAISPKPTGAVTIPSTLGGKPVTSIGGYAFISCGELTNVTIPSSVTSIGEYAFYWCKSLASVMLPNNVTSIGSWAFAGCGITSVTIPDSVISIGNSAFQHDVGLLSVVVGNGNPNYKSISGLLLTKDLTVLLSVPGGLTGVTIPNGVNHIEDMAFCGCLKLTSVSIPDSVISIGAKAFASCSGLSSVTIPDSVKSIGDYAFANCSGLTSVTIPDSVTSMGTSVFSGCSQLTSVIDDGENAQYKTVDGMLLTKDGKTLVQGVNGDVVIPNSVVSIGEGAFSGCSGLTSVKIPDSVTSIGARAFASCSDLTSVTIPDGVTSIGEWAFSSCSGLTDVSIGNGVTSIEDFAFYCCYNLSRVTIGKSVTRIGEDAFMYCGRLTSMTIPDGVTSVGKNAFSCCSNLISIAIGENVASIGGYAFMYCSSLDSISIPDSVISIGDYAFLGCSSLTSVSLPARYEGTTLEHIFSACGSGLTYEYREASSVPPGDSGHDAGSDPPPSNVPVTWYVNGLTGSDSNPGTSESAPKATIQAAIDVSTDGDMILVASGTYAPISTDNRRITIQSNDGALNTIIDGGGVCRCVDTRPTEPTWMVPLYSLTNTVVRGVTLKNGNPCSSDNARGERYAGGGWGGLYYNCIFDSNSAPNGGGGACIWGALFDCLVINCSARNGGACESCVMRNCTFVNNSVQDLGVIGWNCAVMNCIVYGNSGNLFAYMNAQYHGETSLPRMEDFRQENNFVGNPQFVDEANGDYRLAAGSPCIDAGDNSYVTGDKDLAGNARIANGKVDIGCYEYGSSPVGGSLADGLVAYYPFDGNANDASGNGNNGVVHGATLTTDRFGNANNAMYLGWGNWIQVADSESLHSCTQVITIALWAKVDISATSLPQNTVNYITKGAYGHYGDKTRQFALAEVHTADGDYVAMNDPINGLVDNWIRTDCPSVLPVGVWRQIVMSYDGACARTYINGVLIAASNIVTSVGVSPGDLYIGKDLCGGETYCCAAVDDIRIYNRALSAAEVKALYDGTAVTPPEPVTYTVTFDLNGAEGDVPAVRQVTEDSAIGELPTVTREGYDFAGWWTAASGGEAVATNTVVTTDVTFYARWNEKIPVSLADGLVAYYPFTNGSVDDAWTNGYGRTAQNSPISTTDRFGNANCAYLFDGNRSQNIGRVRNFSEMPAGTFTISLWFQTEASYSDCGTGWAWNRGNYAFFPENGDSCAGVGMKVGRDGIEIVEHGNFYMPTVLSYVADIGTGWNHVAVTMTDNGAPILYLNGEFVATGDATDKIKYAGGPIGGGEWGYYTGKVDDVAIYNRALSAAEVEALYSGTEVTPPEPVTYTVTFDMNGAEGAALEGRNVAEGAAVGELPDVTRTGYSFDGWYTAASGGMKISASTRVTANVTYYAQWRINSYTVTFDANGGKGGTVNTLNYGTELTVPTVTRTGYTLTGWSPSVPSTVPASNVTYVAQWWINQYTTTFDAAGGSEVAPITQDYGTELSAPAVTRTGYTFTGWIPAVSSTVPASNATYTAQWRINSYTVTFDAQGGAGGSSAAQDYGTALTAPAVTRTGYTFTGWSPAVEAAVPAGDVTYTAQWTANHYTVTFDANDGTGDMAPTNFVYDAEYALPSNSFANEGHAFAGWSFAPDGEVECNDGEIVSNLTSQADGDVPLYAQWTVNQYTLTFDSAGGSEVAPITQDYGTELTAPTVTREHYTFMGWSPAVPSTVPASNATYTAQWQINQYTVTFDANGGAGGTTRTVTHGATVGALPEPTRKGYELVGWFTEAEGGVAVTASTVVTGNVTYYAQWMAYGGEVADVGFIKAQTVDGVLYGADDEFAGTVQLKAGKINKKKGTVSISASATLLDGKKITGKAVTLKLGDDGTLSGTVKFKAPIGDMHFAMDADGTFTFDNNGYSMAEGTVGGNLPNGTMTFLVDIESLPNFGSGLVAIEDALPLKLTAKVSGGKKIDFGKAASVKYAKVKEGNVTRYVLDGLNDEKKPNVSGLKLTYTPKTGMFKGSFKIYASNEESVAPGKKPTLKTYTVNVTGFIVDGAGVGQATLKNPAASWPVILDPEGS